jgi:hypothetical protein
MSLDLMYMNVMLGSHLSQKICRLKLPSINFRGQISPLPLVRREVRMGRVLHSTHLAYPSPSASRHLGELSGSWILWYKSVTLLRANIPKEPRNRSQLSKYYLLAQYRCSIRMQWQDCYHRYADSARRVICQHDKRPRYSARVARTSQRLSRPQADATYTKSALP